jgi:RES domain
MNRALVDPGQAARQRFMRMSNTDKLGVAIRQFALRLPAEARDHAMALVDPGNLAIMAGALAIWVGAQATPVGWVVNIAMFGMGVVAIGAEAVDVARELRDFAVGVLGADDESELRAAVDHLAKAIAIVGVDVVVALLLKKAIVKVREPKMPVPEGGDSKLLFGKYDPKSAQRRLAPEKPKTASNQSPTSKKTNTPEKNAWHATANPRAAQGVLNGIDPAYLNPNSRFGAAFYVAEQPGTTIAELAHHGVDATHGIRYSVNTDAMKVLDLTNPTTAAEWGYRGGPISSSTQSIGTLAQEKGFNAIRFNSERASGGVNMAVLDDFNEILKPISVSPVKP